MKRDIICSMLGGVLAPITTPFKDGEVSYDALGENIDKYNKTDLKGYMPLGSNGEFLGLTESESLRILDMIATKKLEGKVIVAGCGRESAHATVAFIRKIHSAGLDFAFVLTPHYYKKFMTKEALRQYFLSVADASPVPVVIYNAPKFAAGLEVPAELLREFSGHENIVGMKNSSDTPISHYMKYLDASDDFVLLTGNIGMLYPGLMQGAVGGVLSTATWLPEYCCRLFLLIAQNDMKKAKALYDFIVDVSTKTAGRYGVAGVKYGMELRGFLGGELRLPLLPMASDEKKEMLDYLHNRDIPQFPVFDVWP